jgi:DNA-binding MarR family transcriptional regulator
LAEGCVDDSCRDDYYDDMTKVKSPTRLRPEDRQAAQPPRFDSLEQEAYLNLWRTYDRLKAIEEELFAEFELSAQQYNALRLLRDAAPEALPTLVLAARLVSRAPDITRLVDRLEVRSLVRRERLAHNRRVVRIAITPEGETLLDRMAERVVACGTRQLGHLPSADLTALIDLLRAARRPHEVAEDAPVNPDSRS